MREAQARRIKLSLSGLMLAVLAALFGPRLLPGDAPSVRAPREARSAIGFTSQHALEEHFEKHGPEFGSISQADYLLRAQALRDARLGGVVLEATREDGVVTRFDLRSGAFIAFNADGSIRTFFRPSGGRRYFERQLTEDH
ncbi:MAG: hypothetical protein IPJ19_18615 [Planctomycetes bacterium]|nr:hypothetical protein [Planctomycetota bacterium]